MGVMGLKAQPHCSRSPMTMRQMRLAIACGQRGDGGEKQAGDDNEEKAAANVGEAGGLLFGKLGT